MLMKKIILLITIVPAFTFAQEAVKKKSHAATAYKKWTAISGNDILIYSFMTLSGAADGVNQAIVHHELGRGNRFWDFAKSWKNKYKDFDAGDKRAAFFGSKSVLVGFTDAYHLTRTIDRGFTVAALSISAGNFNQ